MANCTQTSLPEPPPGQPFRPNATKADRATPPQTPREKPRPLECRFVAPAPLPSPTPPPKPRIVVCGLGRTGYKIFCLLRQQGVPTIGISDYPIPGEERDTIVGDAQSATILIAAGIQTAQTLVLAGSQDAQNLAILMQARILNPNIRVVHRLFNTSLGERLDRTLPDHTTLSVSALAAPVFVFAALGSRAIGQLRLFDRTWPIHEELIHPDHPWVGRPLHELWDDLTRMSIYYLPAQLDPEGPNDLVSAVLSDRCLQVGDRLIVASRPTPQVRRKTPIQRLTAFLVSLRRFHRQGRTVLLALLALLVAIAASVVVYLSVNAEVSVADALYFSVGMITGAGGKEEVAERTPDSIKVFTAAMMLTGAGIIGICYALLNDYVLGTRFRQVWDVARVPTRGHFVICGLGGIGLKTAQELRSSGYEVVAIERDPNNRFLNAAKSLGIPAILADASLPDILLAANVAQAEALIAVTSDDMTNLEIALSAKGMAASLPVVVRNQSPRTALMVQQVFEFESVLSPVELAAPSFAAAALGGRILGNGITADILWIALGAEIDPLHPFCGLPVCEAARQGDFVPLYLEKKRRTIHGWELLESYLHAGDVLYLALPAQKIDSLWRSPRDRLIDRAKGKHF